MMRDNLMGIISGTVSSVLSAVLLAIGGPFLPPGAGPQPEAPQAVHRPSVASPLAWSSPPPSVASSNPPTAQVIEGSILEGGDSPTREEARQIQRRILEAASGRLLASPALYMAQAHAESRHRCDAVSPAGAVGCTQMMPRTWEIDVAPAIGCEGIPRTDPECAFEGQIAYLPMIQRWLMGRPDFDLVLAGYNAGAGSIKREQMACAAQPGCNPLQWSNSVEAICLRSAAACAETRGYAPAINRYAKRFEFELGGIDAELGVEASVDGSVEADLTLTW